MKSLIIITALLLAAIVTQGQSKSRHFKEEIYFTLTNGCVTSCEMTQTMYAGSPNIDWVKARLVKYVHPNKVKSIDKVIITQISKSQLRKTTEPFKCPEQYTGLNRFVDTSTAGINKLTAPYATYSFPVVPSYVIFTRMGPLRINVYKNDTLANFQDYNSIRIILKKSRAEWLNDTTLVIK